MKKLLPFSLPIGLIITTLYFLYKLFVKEIPDSISYPIMIISLIFMIIGLIYNGYCFGKKKNPFNFKEFNIRL